MRLGIDASNIRAGGGVTHLVELLQASKPLEHGFEQVVVWAGRSTLEKIGDFRWLDKQYLPVLDRSLPSRIWWQRFSLQTLLIRNKCDLLFVPGGTYSGSFRPFVTMSRNLLPFSMEGGTKIWFFLDASKVVGPTVFSITNYETSRWRNLSDRLCA
jgi:hypothetical protein